MHPNGQEGKGRPVKIDSEGRIIGGSLPKSAQGQRIGEWAKANRHSVGAAAGRGSDLKVTQRAGYDANALRLDAHRLTEQAEGANGNG